MKILNGSDLASFVKERQAKQVRALRQAHGVFPKLAIVQTIDNPVIDSYVRLKRAYGDDILVEVEVYKIDQDQLPGVVDRLNKDPSVHGIIIQLPLADESATQPSVDLVAPAKDVDGLGVNATLDPATPLAIIWLAAGYNVALEAKRIAIVGNGRLVGAPLARLWQASGYDVTVFDSTSHDMQSQLPEFDVIVTATGVPGLITSNIVKQGAVVIDAGTAAEHGKIVGDIDPDLRERDDLTITPEKGGVGPLTVTALFDNVIRAATATIPKPDQ
jgi:methylenetetrahydrofolate dehydrogenase (NADP+)/methenyltetrahydrofolate cyclohydrolase